MNLPTGRYSRPNAAAWRRILEEARKIPRLRKIVENHDATGHPACLNAIMDAALGEDSGHLWLIYYTPKENENDCQ